VRGDVEPVRDGMTLTAVNTFGGLDNDRAKILNRFSGFLPVGFYYKAFHNKRLFPMWERMFRRITGLGTLDFETPHIRTAKRYDFCDVLVVGAGPSGLAAALSAAEAGARVVLVDENQRGGWQRPVPARRQRRAAAHHRRLLDRVRTHPRIRLMEGTYAAAYNADQWVPLVDAEKLTKMRSKAVVDGQRAIEQTDRVPQQRPAGRDARLCDAAPDLPPRGEAGAARGRAGRQRRRLPRRARPARRRHRRGAVVDLRAVVPASAEVAQLRGSASSAWWRTRSSRRTGQPRRARRRDRVPARQHRRPLPETRRIDCDGVALSTGGCRRPTCSTRPAPRCASTRRCSNSCRAACRRACSPAAASTASTSSTPGSPTARAPARRSAAFAGHGTATAASIAPETESPTHPWPIVPHPKGKNFVDFDEDLQVQGLRERDPGGLRQHRAAQALHDGGHGPEPGQALHMTALRILARRDRQVAAAGGHHHRTAVLPPGCRSRTWPAAGSARSGHTPLHAATAALGAVFMQAGAWERPEYYKVAGRTRLEAIRDEAQRVRTAVGLIDVGTLGKLEIRGPQAARVPGARLHRPLLEHEGRQHPLPRVMCDDSGVLTD
jgi:sarcosine oxidase subunit alpha